MINMTWYGVSVKCPDCKGDTVLQSADWSADGEWRFFLWCVKCNEPVRWQVFQSQLAQQAMASDIEKSLAKGNQVGLDRAIGKEIARIAGPVQPPLQPKLNLTAQDLRDLKALKISILPDESQVRPSNGGAIQSGS
jgi:hypothetical protein